MSAGTSTTTGRRTRWIDASFRLVSAALCWSLLGLGLVACAVLVAGAMDASSFALRSATLRSLSLVGLGLGVAAPLGLATAIGVEVQLRHPGLRRALDLDLSVLESVPGFVFGLLVAVLIGVDGHGGRGLVCGGLALAGMLLPGIIAGARLAIAEVSGPELEAGYALGGSRVRLLVHVVLPAAARGLAAVVCRAAGQAFGSAAPLLIVMWLASPGSGSASAVEDALPVQVFRGLAAGEPLGAAVLVLALVAGGLELLARGLAPSAARQGALR